MTIIFLMLVLLAGCSYSPPTSILLPEGNMPMTEQEYKEAKIQLLQQQNLPRREYLRQHQEIMTQ